MAEKENMKITPENTEAEKPKKKKDGFFDSLVVAVVIALFIKTFLIQTYTIPSGSMLDTLLIGDYIIVNRLAYKFGDPERGDVMVFEYPLEPAKSFIKRVIGTPGDKISIRNKQLFINGEPYKEDYKQIKDDAYFPAELTSRDNIEEFTVPEGKYFMMGDNRDASYDGRFWGFISKDMIKGRALLIYWSLETPEYDSPWSKMPLRALRFLNPKYDRFDRVFKLIH
ncbi:signal peptidase I [Geovibrio thiophilus]|uniref:Signal peptidase I n=1 Tax=Geovibrio thiophilus TaxID=139438 RepID=A0A3R5UZG0_9BACT|nr:signal peptidase I [Geovibrio thiophilus]QAR34238.1 signal peptidase I [Geovibrio thiophilus]